VRTLLPSELLAVWKRKGVIQPRYARASGDSVDVANGLIDAYQMHVGKKKKAVKDFVGELEDEGFDYRFVRGLSFLLDKRSIFKCDERISPIDLRRKVFQLTEKFGLPTTSEQRKRIVETVASELKIQPQTVEESLYADLDSELVLEKFDPLSPHDLLKMYNLSLTQTLLFDSTELNFTASGNWQRIFFTIKRLGLIYDVYRDDKLQVKIDGPASLFKMTRRYGTSIAKLLPAVIANPEWTVEAKILWKYTNEICDFKIEGWKHHALLKTYEVPVSYDSVVEEAFAERFEALKSGWLLRREPEPVSAGKQVIIPDFSLERGGVKVYVEIVGFWTSEYLRRKIEKLKMVEESMLVLVNESLACEKLARLGKHPKINILYYKDKIPLAPVLRYLDKAFQGVKTEQKKFLTGLKVVFTEPFVNFEDFAARVGASSEAVRAVLTENPPQEYIVTSEGLLRKDKLEEVGKKIEEQIGPLGQLSFAAVAKMAESEGLEDATSVLDALGYKIAWHGINPENAKVIKPGKKSDRS
jgi:predicted nuclease of restriction endonuclease-like RecB superfamily